jgi:hypothetical protein
LSISLSVTIGISLFTIGKTTVFQTKSVYLSSSGFTATAESQSIVSGLVVATVINLSVHFIGYFKSQIFHSTSLFSVSMSDIAD